MEIVGTFRDTRLCGCTFHTRFYGCKELLGPFCNLCLAQATLHPFCLIFNFLHQINYILRTLGRLLFYHSNYFVIVIRRMLLTTKTLGDLHVPH